MNKQCLLIICFLGLSVTGFSQDKSLYQKHWFIHGNDTLPYRLLLPKSYDASKAYPLILFLHGAGERGNDNEAQLMHGWKLFLQENVRDSFPAIVVFPQCPANSYWSNVEFRYDSISKQRSFHFPAKGEPTTAMKMLIELLDELEDNYRLDDDRYYIGGLSMGGMGTFELVRRKPRTFAAAFPICGGGNTTTARKLRKTSWWIFHGQKDNVVPPELSADMADALKKRKAEVKLTIYPEANHNSWDPAFAEKDLLRWIFSKER